MDTLIDWLNAKDASSRRRTLILIGVLPLLLVAATAFLFPPVAPIAGAVAGAGLFVTAYGWWATIFDADQQDRTDLKAHYPLGKRRAVIGATAAVWVIFLLLAGHSLPAPALGTLNVFVLISLYWLWRATPDEAAAQLEAWEAAQAEAVAEAEAAAQADTDI